ncbi:MAG: hypothetical protein JW973_15940 [Bacteroidales bacterium]|nr:hypothetical protein [Bacteroidales bacterium]
MKKISVLLVFLTISIFTHCQEKDKIQAFIAGYKSNDTILYDNLIKIPEIELNNKDYSIVGFTITLTYEGYVHVYESNSCKITEEMRTSLAGIRKKNVEIISLNLQDIKVRTPKDKEINVVNLAYKIKMK